MTQKSFQNSQIIFIYNLKKKNKINFWIQLELIMNNNSKNGANTTIVSTSSNGKNGGAGATKFQAENGTEGEDGGQTNPAGPSA